MAEVSAIVVVRFHRVRCPACGVKVEEVPQIPGKAPFRRDFEDAVGLACQSASARQVARQFRLSASTVRALDLRYLERWGAARKKPALVRMGVDEIYLWKKGKFITVVCNPDTAEPLWFGRERRKEALDECLTSQLNRSQRMRIGSISSAGNDSNHFKKLARMLVDHIDGILHHCRTKVPLGVVEAVNSNIKALIRRGRGYKDLRNLLLNAERMAAAKTEFVVFRKVA